MTNDELIDPFRRLGFNDVAAYQAAGNITFLADDPDAVQSERLEAALAAAYGFEGITFVRTLDDVRAITDAQPFTREQLATTAGRVQVAFLKHVPDDASIAEVLALTPTEDQVRFDDRQWFWLPTNGVSDSQMPVGAVEKILGPMTIRTFGTISRMLNKFGQ